MTLDDLITDTAYQVRAKTDPKTVERYASLKRAGTDLPPIRVMTVNGAPTLVDGWHRVAAARLVGDTEVVAEITTGTEAELRWESAKANLAHGLPLKKAELRNVLRAYVESAQHRARGKRPKSAREIGRDIGGVEHKTVLGWLKADFPHVHRAIASGGLEGRPERPLEGGPALSLEERRAAEITEAMTKAVSLMRAVRSPKQRKAVADRLRRMTGHAL